MCDAVLKSYGISVTDILMNIDKGLNENALHKFVGIIAFQVIYFKT